MVFERRFVIFVFLEALRTPYLLREPLSGSCHQKDQTELSLELLRTSLAFGQHLGTGSFGEVCAAAVAPSPLCGDFAMTEGTVRFACQMIAKMM